jgi:hypothetical protein
MLKTNDADLRVRIRLRAVPGNHRGLHVGSEFQAAALLKAALLPQRLKFVVFLYRLVRHVTRFGLVRRLGTLLVLRLFLTLFVERDPAAFVFHDSNSFGR